MVSVPEARGLLRLAATPVTAAARQFGHAWFPMAAPAGPRGEIGWDQPGHAPYDRTHAEL